MIKILHLIYDAVRDKIAGGDVHRSRRLLSRLRKNRADLEAFPATSATVGSIAGLVDLSTLMIDSLEERIRLEEAALAALRRTRRAGRPSKDEILRCMLDAERERYGTLPPSSCAKHLGPEPWEDNVQGGGSASEPDSGPKPDGKFRVN